MLTDYFSCYTSLITYPPPFHEEKISAKLKDIQFSNVIKVLGYSNIGVHYIQKEKKKVIFTIFYICVPKKSKRLLYWFSVYKTIIT